MRKLIQVLFYSTPGPRIPGYNSQLPISEDKKKDLLKLCTTKVILEEFHGWYKSLSVIKNKKDHAPEPAVDSDDSDEYLD